MNDDDRNAVIYFMDGTHIVINFPKQVEGAANVAANVRKAIDADKLVIEADGSLIMIPTRNIKYIQVTPLPEALPKDVIRHAHIVG